MNEYDIILNKFPIKKENVKDALIFCNHCKAYTNYNNHNIFNIKHNSKNKLK